MKKGIHIDDPLGFHCGGGMERQENTDREALPTPMWLDIKQ